MFVIVANEGNILFGGTLGGHPLYKLYISFFGTVLSCIQQSCKLRNYFLQVFAFFYDFSNSQNIETSFALDFLLKKKNKICTKQSNQKRLLAYPSMEFIHIVSLTTTTTHNLKSDQTKNQHNMFNMITSQHTMSNKSSFNDLITISIKKSLTHYRQSTVSLSANPASS